MDDDPTIGKLLRTVLEEDGWRVEVAQSLASARVVLGPVNLVLADIRLPNGDGRHLKAHYPNVPFISMSGYAGEAADLPKPFSPTQLLLKVHEVTRKP